MSKANIYGDSSIGHFGVIPFTVDSTREVPYVQYAVLRQGNSGRNKGEVGAQIPTAWHSNTTGPVFSVSFMLTGVGLTNISATELSKLFTPKLSSVSQDRLIPLEWDDKDEEYSLWPNSADPRINLASQVEYCVSTFPITSTQLGGLETGVLHLSLCPNNSSQYDGVEVGILAVNYKLKKNKVAN